MPHTQGGTNTYAKCAHAHTLGGYRYIHPSTSIWRKYTDLVLCFSQSSSHRSMVLIYIQKGEYKVGAVAISKTWVRNATPCHWGISTFEGPHGALPPPRHSASTAPAYAYTFRQPATHNYSYTPGCFFIVVINCIPTYELYNQDVKTNDCRVWTTVIILHSKCSSWLQRLETHKKVPIAYPHLFMCVRYKQWYATVNKVKVSSLLSQLEYIWVYCRL